MWLKADKVVAASLKDLARDKPVSVPSVRYKVLATAAQYLPKTFVTRMAKRGR